MDFIKENKGIAGIAIAVIVGVGAYFAYSAGKTDELLTATSSTPTSQVSQELLITLGDLRSIKLDDSIFSDPVFLSLVDFGIDIPLQPVGRDNPFSPLRASGSRTPAR